MKHIIKLVRIVLAMGAVIAANILLFKWFDTKIAIIVLLIWFALQAMIEIKIDETKGE